MSEPVNLKSLPRHVAVVMDGNGRWAKEKGLSIIQNKDEDNKYKMDGCNFKPTDNVKIDNPTARNFSILLPIFIKPNYSYKKRSNL